MGTLMLLFGPKKVLNSSQRILLTKVNHVYALKWTDYPGV
jgi:hypothetical protein